MKNLILSAFFAVVAFTSTAQSLMINVYAVKTLTNNTTKSAFSVLFDPIRYEASVTEVNIRYIVNFNNNTIQKYEDGELLLDTTFIIVSELMSASKQFFIVFNDKDNHSISLTKQLNEVFEFSVNNNMNVVTSFDNFTIY
jgi:hypothetical protein